jgi:hypothetical protein
VKGGVCIKHGAIVKKYMCSDPTCTNYSQKGGICIKHGAIVRRAKCSDPTCNNNSVKGGLCKKHDAIAKILVIEQGSLTCSFGRVKAEDNTDCNYNTTE